MEHKHPIIDLHLFRDRSFAIGNLLMFMVGFALMSSTVLLPLFLQTIMGYTARASRPRADARRIRDYFGHAARGFPAGRYDARWLLLWASRCFLSRFST